MDRISEDVFVMRLLPFLLEKEHAVLRPTCKLFCRGYCLRAFYERLDLESTRRVVAVARKYRQQQKIRALGAVFRGSVEGLELFATTWLTFLNLGAFEALDLAGLPPLPRLRELVLSDCGLTTQAMAGLGRFGTLRRLTIEENEAALTLAALPDALSELTSLAADQCGITTCATLSRFPKLQSLDVGNSPELDLTSLPATLTGLRELHVMSCDVGDLDVLARFPDLHTLELGGNEYMDLTTLPQGLPIRELSLFSCGIEDAFDVARVAITLEVLNLAENDDLMTSSLPAMPHLKELHLGTVDDLAPLGRYTSLESLFLTSGPDDNPTPLDTLPEGVEFPKLRSVHLCDCFIFDWTPTAAFVAMEELHAGGNPEMDVNTLPDWPRIRVLHLPFCGLTDLSFLSRYEATLEDLQVEFGNPDVRLETLPETLRQAAGGVHYHGGHDSHIPFSELVPTLTFRDAESSPSRRDGPGVSL